MPFMGKIRILVPVPNMGTGTHRQRPSGTGTHLQNKVGTVPTKVIPVLMLPVVLIFVPLHC